MFLNFQKRLTLGLLLSFSIFAALSWYTFSNNKQQLVTNLLVAHSNQVLLATEQLLNHLLNAETGQRGYIITHQKEFLKPYFESIDSVDYYFQKVEDLTTDNPALQAIIHKKLEPLIRNRLEIMQSVIAAHDSKFEFTDIIRKGKEAMDSVRLAIFNMQKTEQELLRKRSLASAEKVSLFNSTYLITIVMIASILGILFVVIYKNLKARDVAEYNLKEASNEIKDLYNHAPCGYHSLDASGTFIEINDTLLDWLGRNREEVIGVMPFRDILSKKSEKRFQENFEHFKKDGFLKNAEMEFIRKNGTILPVIVNSTAVYDASGEFVKSRTSTFDTAERKNAEEERDSFFNNTLDLLVVLTMEGTFLRWNLSWTKELGYTNDEMLGKNIIDFVHPDDVERTFNVISAKLLIGERVAGFENRYRCKDGSYVWLLWNAVSSVEKGLIYGFARDITKRMQTEEKMLQLNKELEAFTYSVSHDLRAPLRSITGFAQILQNDYIDKLDAEARRISNIVIKSAQEMGQLIDDLLDFSRMGRKELSSQDINMKNLVEEIVADLRTQQNGRKINIAIHPLKSSLADRSMLKQVWTNLISNALKYTGKRENTEIEIGSYHEADKTCYYIEDNGAGFNMVHIDKLFGVFQRLHKTSEFEGTGVGLALVKRIVERHGGNVWAEGKVNIGAKFYFTLPSNQQTQ